MFSIADASGFNLVPTDHVFVTLKSYFDGGGQADPKQHRAVTLASFSGTQKEWSPFEKEWRKTLAKHKAEWLHTTEALTFNDIFERKYGWDEARVDKFIDDCVSVIAKHSAVTDGGTITQRGIRPCTITIVLKDIKRAYDANPMLPSIEELCVTQCAAYCQRWGRSIGAESFEFSFDRGEKFRGNMVDRWNNPRARRDAPELSQIVGIGELDMRVFPAIQAADLLAWVANKTISDGDAFSYPWQERLEMEVTRDKDLYHWDTLLDAIRPNTVDLPAKWRIPRRRNKL